jgi:ribosomal protein S18 acetylase RimI-like enzyme
MSASELPLSRRVGPSPEPQRPAHPDIDTWRPATVGDVDELLAFHADVARADHPEWIETRDEVMEAFEVSHIDPARDTMLGIDRGGRILAAGSVVVPTGRETLVRAIAFGAVRPEARARGIGRALLGWQLERARERLAAFDDALPGWIIAYAEERAPDAGALLERAGLPQRRHFFTLGRDVSLPIESIAPRTDDVDLVPWAAEWTESTRLARNEAFADHWGSQSTAPETWSRIVGGEQFAPSLSFVAVEHGAAGDRVVGFVLALRNEGDWAGQGFSSSYVQLVGVVRERRGRGIAQGLLARHLEACRDEGLDQSILDVDAESPTGALGLYEGLGYVVANTHHSHVLEY